MKNEKISRNGLFHAEFTFLVAGGEVEAHKVILASSSPFFQNILRRSKHPHPMIYMRGLKGDDLSAIVNFLFCGEANVFQENLDSFLAIAEELQLKGLMRKAGGDELTESEPVEMPKQANLIDKKETTSSDIVQTNSSEEISGNELESVDTTVELRSFGSGDLQELDEICNAMMEKTSKKRESGNVLYKCQVCGKEAISGDLKSHIAANHLGVLVPCNLCEKTFRSRKAFAKHNRCHY